MTKDLSVTGKTPFWKKKRFGAPESEASRFATPDGFTVGTPSIDPVSHMTDPTSPILCDKCLKDHSPGPCKVKVEPEEKSQLDRIEEKLDGLLRKGPPPFQHVDENGVTSYSWPDKSQGTFHITKQPHAH